MIVFSTCSSSPRNRRNRTAFRRITLLHLARLCFVRDAKFGSRNSKSVWRKATSKKSGGKHVTSEFTVRHKSIEQIIYTRLISFWQKTVLRFDIFKNANLFVMVVVGGGFKEESNNSDLVTVPNNTDQDVTKCRSTVGGSFRDRCVSLTPASGDYVTPAPTLREGERLDFEWKSRRSTDGVSLTSPSETPQHTHVATSGADVRPGVPGAVLVCLASLRVGAPEIFPNSWASC